MEAPEARNNAPSQGLSAQIGRLVTERRIPVYPAREKPSNALIPATSFPSAPRCIARSAGEAIRPSSAITPSADRTENAPNARTTHAPNEMGDHALNMMAGKLWDWTSMCQKRSGCPRSTVSSRPQRIAPQAAT